MINWLKHVKNKIEDTLQILQIHCFYIHFYSDLLYIKNKDFSAKYQIKKRPKEINP